MTNNYDQIVSFANDNVEALVKSSNAALKGFQEMAKLYATLATQTVELTSSAVKALAAVKTPADLQSIYTGLAKQSFDTLVSESRKATELATSVATDTFAPINARAQSLASFVTVSAA